MARLRRREAAFECACLLPLSPASLLAVFHAILSILRAVHGRQAGLIKAASRRRTQKLRYGITRNGTLLESVPPGVTTWTVPVVAPAGTVVVISEGETTVNLAIRLTI